MANVWMPGVERRPENNGGSMSGGPPRAVWHITWDELGKGGKLPSFDAIANYLQSVNYAPHLMWNPWTGKIVQFYPANQSARALSNTSASGETNRQGKVCIQVEVHFSPGAVVDGKKYLTVADTPCKGLDKIVAWMRTWGIPDAWPMGWPKWSGNFRSTTTWRTKAGHYGHCHVPENDHTDPGPMPRDMFGSPKPAPVPSPQKPPDDWMRVTVALLPTLRRGATGRDVRTVQGLLCARGTAVVVDGDFGPATETRVRQEQTTAGLASDGVVGPDTWRALITGASS